MTPERWATIERVYHEAAARRGEERTAFLNQACGGDDALRREVESLLAHDGEAAFLSTPAVAAIGGASLVGRSLGPYAIQARLGEGGMGEVYRARDTKLGRDVAIKVLPRLFTSDAERRARFEREARMLAALNHPHIGAIYGLEDAGDVRALVLDLVEGPTLAERLTRVGRALSGPPNEPDSLGPGLRPKRSGLPLDEALAIAKQIAEALEAAHEQGIIHRDLKPANIKVREDGTVKVLDFGLAKALDPVGASSANATKSPTMSMHATQAGMILGTAAYMSPEQTRGQPVDKRTDIWAFGCVLYEMLTGRLVFGGATLSDTIAAILEREPRWDLLPAATPQSIQQLLRRCLDKDPKRRLRDIGDARLEIDDGRTAPAISADPGRHARPVRFAAWAAATLCVAATVILARWYLRGAPTTDAPVIRFSVLPADGVPRRGVPALSPDGRRLAFVANRNGVRVVWVRSLDAVEAQPVPGSEDANFAFWSPASRSLAFFTSRDGLEIIDDFGASARKVGPIEGSTGSYGAMWIPDGRIVVGSLQRGLFAIPAKGGSSSQLTSFDLAHGEGGQVFPTMLPDGHHFLYLSEPSSSIWLASLDSKERTRLMSADSQAMYVPPGYLLFVRRQTLLAQPFDLHRLMLTGEPVAIAEGVLTEVNYGADFTASSNGMLAYRTGTLHVPTQLTWVDRAGKQLGTVGPPGRYANIELSPDGTHLALEALNPRSYTKDIWIMELSRGVLTQLTFDSGNETFPIWSPDGDWIMFGSDREGGWQLYRRRADSIGDDERVATSAEAMVPQSWAPDGRSVVYLQRPANLGVLSLVGPRTLRLFDQARFEGFGRLDGHGQVSPDGNWLAYGSNASGPWQLSVESFPKRGGGKWQISKDGGISPVWRRDGHELFYYSPEGWLVSVPVATGTALTIGAAVPLFKANLLGGPVSSIPWRTQYAVTSDGKRFLLNEPLEDAYARAPITVVTNWMAAAKK